MPALPDDFRTHLDRVDPDRCLAARFVAEPSRRDELLALYALNDELARVAESVRAPLLGEMRLAWWSEALDDVAAGRGGRGHPVLEALAPALTEGRLLRPPLGRMIDARAADLLREPFADEAALEAYLDGTAGALMGAAAGLLEPRAGGLDLSAAGRAWGWAGLWRAREAWAARNRRWTPLDWTPSDGTREAEPETLRRRVEQRVVAALKEAREPLRALPTAAFPAVAYAALARGYARGRTPSPLGKRATLLAATLRGRL